MLKRNLTSGGVCFMSNNFFIAILEILCHIYDVIYSQHKKYQFWEKIMSRGNVKKLNYF